LLTDAPLSHLPNQCSNCDPDYFHLRVARRDLQTHIALQLHSELCGPSSDGRRLDVSEILRVIDEPATGIRRHHSSLRLPQREDDCLVVEAIAESLRRDISDISPSQG
jgi:hypothetical protein